jgi:hypothetical protein
MKVKILNPNMLQPGDLVDLQGGSTWNNQPKLEDEPAAFPSEVTDPVLGNDDVTTSDERNNPYIASSDANNSHAIGETSSSDIPRLVMRHSTGVNGNTFELRYHFGEFLRLLIGNKWYRCSNRVDWRVHYKVQKQNGMWIDHGSVMAPDNTGF